MGGLHVLDIKKAGVHRVIVDTEPRDCVHKGKGTKLNKSLNRKLEHILTTTCLTLEISLTYFFVLGPFGTRYVFKKCCGKWNVDTENAGDVKLQSRSEGPPRHAAEHATSLSTHSSELKPQVYKVQNKEVYLWFLRFIRSYKGKKRDELDKIRAREKFNHSLVL